MKLSLGSWLVVERVFTDSLIFACLMGEIILAGRDRLDICLARWNWHLMRGRSIVPNKGRSQSNFLSAQGWAVYVHCWMSLQWNCVSCSYYCIVFRSNLRHVVLVNVVWCWLSRLRSHWMDARLFLDERSWVTLHSERRDHTFRVSHLFLCLKASVLLPNFILWANYCRLCLNVRSWAGACLDQLSTGTSGRT